MRPRSIILATLCLPLLAACEAPRADFDPHERFQATAEKGHAVATLRAPLAPTDLAVLADLAAEHARRGAGPVSVTVAFGGDEAPARGFADHLATALDGEGAAAVVTMVRRDGVAVPEATVAVPVWVARVPDCGSWDEGIGADFRNQNTANFGCAITRNMGLMVANPADLARARDATGRSGARAADVLGKYGEGKPTAAKAEDAKPSVTLSTIGTK